MGTSKNIIVGAAAVYIGPSVNEAAGADITAKINAWRPTVAGTARYTTVLDAAPAKTAGWRDVGYTQDGLELATDPSWGEVEVDQLLDAAKIFKDGMSLSISTTFAEATLENLLVAWGQKSSWVTGSASGTTENEIAIEGGRLGEAPVERGLIAIGNAPEHSTLPNVYGERTYFAYRVLSVDASTIGASRAEASTIPVTFRALPADNGRYGAVRDRLNVTG